MTEEKTPPSKRSRLAFALALVALAAAAVAALGPAGEATTTYSWPPRTLPDESPRRVWYTPLLLVREQAAAITARIPCDLPPALPDAERPVTIFATARNPATRGALEVLGERNELVVRSGGSELTRVGGASVPAVDGACSYVLQLADNRWTLQGGRGQDDRGGDLSAMPYVSGLFSELDLRAEPAPSIELTTVAHAARPTILQKLAWIVAALCAVAALLLVSVRSLRPRAAQFTTPLRRAARQARPEDAVVAVVLLVWWVIGPSYFDDGWVVARQSMFESSGGFSNYYDSFAGNHPLGYWLEWLQHWLVEITSALLVLRLPALASLVVVWILCRWLLARALQSSSVGHQRLALVALTSAFLVGAMAWGMTLRPEPEVAVLVTGVLACTVRFLERNTAAPIALATVFVVLGLTAHPAAIVAFAPLLVIAPTLLRWARPRLTVVATIVGAGLALAAVFVFVGADLDQRRAEAQELRTYGNAIASWREEVTRYASLNDAGMGTPIRRESAALMALAVMAFLLRPRREKRPVLDLPGAALPVALLLLIPTPAKWSWHFGALIGLVAVAVACETARFREEGDRSRGWSARPLLAVGAAVVAAAWAPGIRPPWNELDLMTQAWTLRFERAFLTLPKIAALVPVALLVAAGIFELVRRGRGHLDRVPWRVASWTAPALAVPLVAYTAAVLVADGVRTPSWTLSRQNVETLTGDLRCGLADDAIVASTASMRPLTRVGDGAARAVPPWAPSPPLPGLDRYYLGLVEGNLVARTPWFEARGDQPIGLFLAGRPPGSLELEWAWRENGRTKRVAAAPIDALLVPEERTDFIPWRFFPASELPPRAAGANAVRIVLRSGFPVPATVVTSPPVVYANEALADRLERPGSRTLVPPHILTYVPCADQPVLRDGVVEVPDQIVGQRASFFPMFDRPATPFTGVMDVYRLQRLPLTDSEHPPRDIVLYDIDQWVPGGALAAPDKRTEVS